MAPKQTAQRPQTQMQADSTGPRVHRLSNNQKGTNFEAHSNLSSVNDDQAVEGAEAIAPGQQSNIENKKDLLRAKSFNIGKIVTNDPNTPLSKVLQ